MTIAVIRIHGTIKINRDIRDTLVMLRLHRPNHCVLVRDSPQNLGMLQKVKDWVTWGPVDAETTAKLIRSRGRLDGDLKVDDAAAGKLGKFKTVDDLATAVVDGSVEWSKLEGTVPVFRLHPPRKGHEGMKRSFVAGGALGNRGADINRLIEKML